LRGENLVLERFSPVDDGGHLFCARVAAFLQELDNGLVFHLKAGEDVGPMRRPWRRSSITVGMVLRLASRS
jgi:hypothetical protein